ncbi:Transient receptor potential channel pyrexia [Harpegnathos saltator]|uniref:Transient receptor potential channel pyrexia n=1 Tax=Harpegnathos saltator TaxID=610380 RepID=E2B942_HARSA|nr:Transient receptor potential channel pyrexia [Harpegnathos saltator]
MEEAGERTSRLAPTSSLRHAATSLLLARWISSTKLPKQADSEIEDDEGFECVPADSVPHAGEDYSICISEFGYSTEIDRSSLRINEDFIRNLLTEHARRAACRSQLCEELEQLSRAEDEASTEAFLAACKPQEINTPTCLDVFERRLDAAVNLHRQGVVAGELELRLDFRPLLQHRRHGEIGYLDAFVKEGYKEILEHPLCQSFLHLKWQKIRKYYAARLLFYLLYVLILTSWVMTGLAYNCYNESHGHARDPPLCAKATGLYGFLYRHPALLGIQWYTLVMLTLLEAFRKFTVMPSYLSVRHFFTQPENLVDWCVILSVFATSFVYTGKTYAWQSYLGAFAVLCGWSNLMLMIGQLPMFGAYVAMFTSVQAQVFKLLLAYACLLVGFTASFCVIFPHSKSFGSPHTALIKVLAMMTGELGFEDLFFPSNESIAQTAMSDVEGTSWVLLQISAQLSFVLFLLFVTIVLMNLLIGIAVHDIKGLQKTAGLAKLVRQTKLIYDVEVALFFALLPKRLIKCLRWSALILPSPMRAVLTVRPLNPRETRLPRDVLSAAYKVAKEGDGHSNFAVSRKKTYGAGYYAKACMKGDISSGCRRRGFDEDTLTQDCNRLKDDIAELRKICERNQALLRELAKTHK